MCTPLTPMNEQFTRTLPVYFPSKDFMTVLKPDNKILLTDIPASKLRSKQNQMYVLADTSEGSVLIPVDNG